MTTFVTHTGYVTGRWLRAFSRQPAYMAISLAQPLIWLLIFGQLFKTVATLPGFGSGSYIDFLTPGIVVMTALFSSGWSGTSFIQDMDRGVMDRMLTSPVSRGALMTGQLLYQAVTTAIQAVIVILVGLAAGAEYPGGIAGVLVTIVAAVLLGAGFSSFSNAIALLMRSQESLIGISQFVALPLMFLSSAMMAAGLSPEWVQDVARYNPVEWAVVASREALAADPDWGIVIWRLGLLAVFALVIGWLATRAFRTYQRSI